MIENLQKAYDSALKNLVFVNFVDNVDKCVAVDMLELELAKEKACCKDLLTAINLHFSVGDYDLAKERIAVLEKSIDYINRLESQIKEQRRNKLFEVASQLCKQGRNAKVVKFHTNPI